MLDLRTERPECLEIGTRALFKQSGSWKSHLDEREQWWNWFATIKGYNGAGGYWIEQELCWSSGGTHTKISRSLSWEESRDLEREIERLKTEAKKS